MALLRQVKRARRQGEGLSSVRMRPSEFLPLFMKRNDWRWNLEVDDKTLPGPVCRTRRLPEGEKTEVVGGGGGWGGGGRGREGISYEIAGVILCSSSHV